MGEKGEKKAIQEDQLEILTNFNPVSAQDFTKFAAAIIARTKKYEESPVYPVFVRELCKSLCSSDHLDSTQVADVGKTLNTIVNDKLKAEKAPKKGMKKTAAKKKAATTTKVVSGDIDEEDDVHPVGNDDYDDFM